MKKGTGDRWKNIKDLRTERFLGEYPSRSIAACLELREDASISRMFKGSGFTLAEESAAVASPHARLQ